MDRHPPNNEPHIDSLCPIFRAINSTYLKSGSDGPSSSPQWTTLNRLMATHKQTKIHQLFRNIFSSYKKKNNKQQKRFLHVNQEKCSEKKQFIIKVSLYQRYILYNKKNQIAHQQFIINKLIVKTNKKQLLKILKTNNSCYLFIVFI